MSDNLGPIALKDEKDPYKMRLFGEEMEDAIGKEVKQLIDTAYNDAQTILKQNIDKLDKIAQALLKKEKINENEFKSFFEE